MIAPSAAVIEEEFVKELPTHIFLEIPAPPETTIAPVLEDVAGVVEVKVLEPEELNTGEDNVPVLGFHVNFVLDTF